MTGLASAAATTVVGGVSLPQLAECYGTPCYVYDAALIRAQVALCQELCAPLGATLHYAVKANGNLALLGLMAAAKIGFDVASVGELERVRMAGGNLAQTVFTGPGKTRAELEKAVAAELSAIICESADELTWIEACARAAGLRARVGVRVNPAVEADTHPYIATGGREAKFGVAPALARDLLGRAERSEHLEPAVLHAHIGSQITSVAPYVETVAMMLELAAAVEESMAVKLRLDLGGGFAIGAADENPGLRVLADLTRWLATHAAGRALSFEPGRMLVAQAGLLLTKVEYVKERHVVIDAGMNDLLRPALYGARHPVVPVGSLSTGSVARQLVGPVCETADSFAETFKWAVVPGDLLAICDAGAYGSCMASNYNGRPRPCEIMIDEGRPTVIRRRDSIADMLSNELQN